MDKDFSIVIYKKLIETILSNNFDVLTVQDYFTNKIANKIIILKHDVDKLIKRSKKMAEVELKLGIKSSYFFRSKFIKNKDIRQISDFGHEVGYHYEDLAVANGNSSKAINLFESNLGRFRKNYSIKTICMHGSPLSKYDNRELWNVYDYRDYGIIGEPYFDIDFNEVLYLTDTGRAWNTSKGNVRDRVQSRFNYNFKSTHDIIRALENEELPDKIMLNVHPHRWFDNYFLWTKELVFQKTKNIIKSFLPSR